MVKCAQKPLLPYTHICTWKCTDMQIAAVITEKELDISRKICLRHDACQCFWAFLVCISSQLLHALCVSVRICLRACDFGPVPLLLATVPQKFSRVLHTALKSLAYQRACIVVQDKQLAWLYCEYISWHFTRLFLPAPDSVVADSCVKQWRNFDFDWEWRGSASRCLPLCFGRNSILDLVMANFRAWLITAPMFISSITDTVITGGTCL